MLAYNSLSSVRIGPDMPSLIRLLTILGILAGLALAGIWSLANLIQPETREITITIPPDRIGK